MEYDIDLAEEILSDPDVIEAFENDINGSIDFVQWLQENEIIKKYLKEIEEDIDDFDIDNVLSNIQSIKDEEEVFTKTMFPDEEVDEESMKKEDLLDVDPEDMFEPEKEYSVGDEFRSKNPEAFSIKRGYEEEPTMWKDSKEFDGKMLKENTTPEERIADIKVKVMDRIRVKWLDFVDDVLNDAELKELNELLNVDKNHLDKNPWDVPESMFDSVEKYATDEEKKQLKEYSYWSRKKHKKKKESNPGTKKAGGGLSGKMKAVVDQGSSKTKFKDSVDEFVTDEEKEQLKEYSGWTSGKFKKQSTAAKIMSGGQPSGDQGLKDFDKNIKSGDLGGKPEEDPQVDGTPKPGSEDNPGESGLAESDEVGYEDQFMGSSEKRMAHDPWTYGNSSSTVNTESDDANDIEMGVEESGTTDTKAKPEDILTDDKVDESVEESEEIYIIRL